MGVGTVLTGIGIAVSALVNGIIGGVASKREREALEEARVEARGLAAQQRGDILAEQEAQRGLTRKGLRLQERQLMFNRDESDRAQKNWERQFAVQNRQQAIQNTLGIINQDATLRARFSQMMAPRR